MVESTASQGDLHSRALQLYQQGTWDQVIDLLVDVEEKTDDMRSLLAAARWQVAFARAKQRARAQTREAPSPGPTPQRRLSSRAMPVLLIVANLLIYGALAVIVLAIWQERSVPSFSAFAMPASEPPLLSQAEAAIEARDWDHAISVLQALLESQPENVEARNRLSYALEQRQLESKFAQAKGYYSRQLWDQALAGFQSLRASAPLFRTDEVADHLCRTYIQTLRAQIAEAQGNIGKLLPLRTKIMEYVAECNADEFSVEQHLLDLYIAGIEAAQMGRWTEAIDLFEQIRKFEPNYIGDGVTQQLYLAHVNLGKAHAGQGQWSQALNEYDTALAFGVTDVMGATDLRTEAVYALATPTLTPTATPVPETPTATATPKTPTPSRTVRLTPTTTPSMTVVPTPTHRPQVAPILRPRPSAAPTSIPMPTLAPMPAPPQPAPPMPTATQSPPTSTPAPSPTPRPPATATPFEEHRPPTPTPQRTPTPFEEKRPPTPTQEPGA